MDPTHITSIYQAAREDKSQKYSFSYEYYPPKTDKAVVALYKRFWRMCQQKPLFADVTWGAGGTTSDLTLELTSNAKRMFGFEMNMHMTCTNMPKDKVEKSLKEAKEQGLKNIMALRGDPPEGKDKWEALEGGFTCALDLIKYIKKEYKDYFCISCAGYPEGHPLAITCVEESELGTLTETEKHRLVKLKGKYMVCRDKDFVKEIEYLKKKVDAGAQMIITQLFYDIEAFASFVKTCREVGITVPILPGIMPIMSYAGFGRMTGFCKTRVPEKLASALEKAKDDKAAMNELAVDYVATMCKEILDRDLSPHLHFYCLNMERPVYAIMKRLGWPVKSKEELEGEEQKKAYAKVSELISKKTAEGATKTVTTEGATKTVTTEGATKTVTTEGATKTATTEVAAKTATTEVAAKTTTEVAAKTTEVAAKTTVPEVATKTNGATAKTTAVTVEAGVETATKKQKVESEEAATKGQK